MTRGRLRRWRDPLLGSWILCALLFLVTLPLPRADGLIVGSDGIRYFAILRSLVHDHDFGLADEYAHLGVEGEGTTVTGLQSNPFAIGCSLLWSPFYLAAGALGGGLRAAGVNVPADGYGLLDQAAVCLGSIFYAGLGFLLARRIARRHAIATNGAIDIALVMACWATPAIYYIVAEPSMSHANTLFTVAFFFWLWTPIPTRRSRLSWIVIGLAAGLATLTRWQDALILLLPAGEIGYRVFRQRWSPLRALEAAVLLGAAFTLAVTPQLLMWNAIYGSPLLVPQGNDFFQWWQPHLLESLFSTRHGLLSWHPLLLLALAGLPALARRSRALALGIGVYFAASWYVNSAVTRWWADDAFGGRRYIGLLPLLALALAALLGRFLARSYRERVAVYALLGALVAWNGLAAAQYRLGLVPRDQALTLRQMTVDRLLLPIELLRRRLG